MACVGKEPGGRKRVLFVAQDSKRQTIRLGKTSMGQAEAFKVKIESLMTSQFTGRVDDEVARWLAGLGDKMYAKLAAVGLVGPRVVEPAAPKPSPAPESRLSEFISEYIRSRIDAKLTTLKVYQLTRTRLLAFFPADKLLSELTPGDADSWRLYLIKRGLADNTVRKSCKVARQFFRSALRHKLIAENPFSELKLSAKSNRTRDFFVSRQDTEKILGACPDINWKIIFVLARYGALRTPSETLLLRWADINWDLGKMLVRSPKTEHHQDHESRFVPIFPELRGYLLEAFEQAEPGAEFVITNHRLKCGNLRAHMGRIIEKAGVKPWPKMFQNLRSTRETELCERWPEHVVCTWLGHSETVARRHYLQTTDEHFRQATQLENPAQNPAQQSRAADCEGLQDNRGAELVGTDLQPVAAGGAMSQGVENAPWGPGRC